jgi:uncharacterized SAM-binding protein YcdF (DUF218 family)
LIFLFTLTCVVLSWNESNRLGQLLVLPLEQRFQRPTITAPESLTGIIVLTGDEARLAEAGRLARLYPHLEVVISGADGMPALPAGLGGGIAPGRVVLEGRAGTTYENAVYSAGLIRRKPGERWLLVTGALHMARAIGAFRRIGFDVEPWPVEETDRNGPEIVRRARREWVALLAYRLLGRTSALLPGPRS